MLELRGSVLSGGMRRGVRCVLICTPRRANGADSTVRIRDEMMLSLWTTASIDIHPLRKTTAEHSFTRTAHSIHSHHDHSSNLHTFTKLPKFIPPFILQIQLPSTKPTSTVSPSTVHTTDIALFTSFLLDLVLPVAAFITCPLIIPRNKMAVILHAVPGVVFETFAWDLTHCVCSLDLVRYF